MEVASRYLGTFKWRPLDQTGLRDLKAFLIGLCKVICCFFHKSFTIPHTFGCATFVWYTLIRLDEYIGIRIFVLQRYFGWNSVLINIADFKQYNYILNDQRWSKLFATLHIILASYFQIFPLDIKRLIRPESH